MNKYLELISTKRHSVIESGIKPVFSSDDLFDYQKFVVDKAVRMGRHAVFLDTGLGKTLIQLCVAQNYIQTYNKPALIVTPLAVAFQFIKEADKFGFQSIEYSRTGNHTKEIVLCNYEQIEKFNPDDFSAILLDESSILKNADGATRITVNSFLRKAPYRFLFTATPSPNDFVELGTASEALGHLGYVDMLGRFFTNRESSLSPNDIGVKWILKPHATDDFFSWVSGWATSMRKPSDLGFDDSRHILPSLTVNDVMVKNIHAIEIDGQMEMFVRPSSRLTEVREETKKTLQERCEIAVSLAQKAGTSVYWCNLNYEAELIRSIDKDAAEVKGSDSIEKKEDTLLAFAEGKISRLITKPKITSFGLNWQHCNHTVFFPTFSYEQYYQAVRRFWRFGQKNPVTVDLVYSEGQEKVITALKEKQVKADALFSKLNSAVNKHVDTSGKEFAKKLVLPTFVGGK